MEILTNKQNKEYFHLSRYSQRPIYYNKLDDKYQTSIGTWLNDTTTYSYHKIESGDTLDTIALKYYNNPTLFWVIADFNRITDSFKKLDVGTYIKIPTISDIEFK